MLMRSFHTTATCLRRKSHYEVLNVQRHADKNTIKKQYYRLSKQYHPDLNPNNPAAHAKFLEVNNAYAVLGNEASRRQYDAEESGSRSSSSGASTSSSDWYHATSGFRTGPSASWHGRARRHQRQTGSTSARQQAAGQGSTGSSSSHAAQAREEYNRYYEAEEVRRRHRLHQAAERRRAAGKHVEPDAEAYRRIESWWSRLWRLAIVLGAIGYATQTIRTKMSGASIIKSLIATKGPMTTNALSSFIPQFEKDLVSKSHMKKHILPQLLNSGILRKKIYRDHSTVFMADGDKSKKDIFAWEFCDPESAKTYKNIKL
ncbi:hypothetical protein BX666DRAFT_2029186 [Dichotomocladium elegans]|nr:hypothetical protein BX666DRAFT_2029186 [Dichotomocladium elegans]